MNRVTVRLFAGLRESVGKEELVFETREGESCREILRRLESEFQSVAPLLEHCLVAVNGVYAPRDTEISPGDEVALLPPVSGG